MDTVLVEKRQGWRRITLNRPDKLNAFNRAMHEALAEALAEAEADPDCRAVLLTGAGRGFCAGQDLEALTGDGLGVGEILPRYYNPLVQRLREMPKPIVCAVNGTAAGAGASIALACDIVLAAKGTRFIQAFSKIALVPDSGGTWLLPRVVGDARARALCLLGEPITAETAESWGMIWRAVDPDVLAAEAEALVERLATMPTAALALIKSALDASSTNTFADQLALETKLQVVASRLPDHAEGVAAFMAKRPAAFTGRPA